jgi:MFS transporter, PPP family, 3-phenylpropionic acid transporter
MTSASIVANISSTPMRKIITRELITILVIVGLAIMVMSLLQPVLPLFLASLGIDAKMIGLMFSVGMAGMVIGESSGGWLADRIGIKAPFIISTLVCAPLVLSFAFTTSPYLIFIIFFFWGIARAAIFGPGRGYIATKVPLAYKATFMALYATSMAVARSAGSFSGGLISDLQGFKWVFYIGAMIGIAAGLVTIFGLKTRRKPVLPSITIQATPDADNSPPLYRNRTFIFQSAIAAMQFAAVGISPFLSLLGAEVAHLDATEIGILFTIGAVVNAILLIPMGRIADHHSKRNMMAIGLLVIAAGQAIIGLSGNFLQLALGVIIQSTGGAMFSPAAVTLLSENIPLHRQNTAMGIYGACEDAGVILGSALGGVVWSTLGPAPTFLILGTGSATIGAFMSLTLLKTQVSRRLR